MSRTIRRVTPKRSRRCWTCWIDFRRWWRTPGWGWRLPTRRGWRRCMGPTQSWGRGCGGTWKRRRGRLPWLDWRGDGWRLRLWRVRRGTRSWFPLLTGTIWPSSPSTGFRCRSGRLLTCARWASPRSARLPSLPANAVRTRYGTEGALAWRLAHGEDPQPLKGRTQPIVLREAIDFEWEEHNVDRLTFALQALAQRLATRLAKRGLMAQQVGQPDRAFRRHGPAVLAGLCLSRPASAASLRDAARWRLEAWAGAAQDDSAMQEILIAPARGRPHWPGGAAAWSRGRARSGRCWATGRSTWRAPTTPSAGCGRSWATTRCFGWSCVPRLGRLRRPARRVDAYVETGTQRDDAPTPLGTAWLAGLAGARGLTRLFTPPRPVRISSD